MKIKPPYKGLKDTGSRATIGHRYFICAYLPFIIDSFVALLSDHTLGMYNRYPPLLAQNLQRSIILS